MNSIFKLRKNLFIEITLLVASALSIIATGINIYILIFSIAIHELGHIIAALLNGATAENFSVHGFGVELTFPGETPSPKRLFYISLGGPLISLFIALISYYTNHSQIFILNICICAVNMLPVYPLDGGNIFYSILTKNFPRTKMRFIFKFLGRLIGLVICFCGILVLYISTFNISLIYMGLFIFFSAGRLQNPVTEITSVNYSKIEKSSLFVIDSSLPLLEAANNLPINSVGAIKNDEGKIISFVTPLYLYQLASKKTDSIL